MSGGCYRQDGSPRSRVGEEQKLLVVPGNLWALV